MIILERKYIEYLAELAKLELDESIINKVQDRIEMFSGYAKKLAEIDTEDIKPLINMNNEINVLREDKVGSSLDRDIVLNNAPEKMYGCIKVKKIIE